MNKNQINIWDYVYTFLKSDKYPIARRRIRMIIENDKWVRLDLIPTLDPEYHAKEETTVVNLENCFLSREEFIKHIESEKEKDLENHKTMLDKIYWDFLYQASYK
jgi:hypothetical protein